MPELKFDTGLVEYDLNGKCKVTFNPSDREFVERLYSAVEQLEKTQDEYKKKMEPLGPGKELFAVASEQDKAMKKIIDEFFGVPVCKSLFENMSVCAFADGLPVWLNLMLALVDEINESVGDIEKKADPRVKKYTDKYQKHLNKGGK